MKYRTIFSLGHFIAVLVFSCSSDIDSRSQQALNDALSRFPNLPMEKGDLKNHYKLLRSLEITYPYVKIKLYEPINIESKQRIVLITNKEGLCSVILWPSSRYKSYWNYEYDTSKKPNLLPGGTFESVVNDALLTLKLNQGNDGITVLGGLFKSLLECQYVGNPEIYRINASIEKGFPDTCLQMQRKVSEDLKSRINHNAIRNNMIYWQSGGQIYSFKFKDKLKKNKPVYYKIDTYRLPYIVD